MCVKLRNSSLNRKHLLNLHSINPFHSTRWIAWILKATLKQLHSLKFSSCFLTGWIQNECIKMPGNIMCWKKRCQNHVILDKIKIWKPNGFILFSLPSTDRECRACPWVYQWFNDHMRNESTHQRIRIQIGNTLSREKLRK